MSLFNGEHWDGAKWVADKPVISRKTAVHRMIMLACYVGILAGLLILPENGYFNNFLLIAKGYTWFMATTLILTVITKINYVHRRGLYDDEIKKMNQQAWKSLEREILGNQPRPSEFEISFNNYYCLGLGVVVFGFTCLVLGQFLLGIGSILAHLSFLLLQSLHVDFYRIADERENYQNQIQKTYDKAPKMPDMYASLSVPLAVDEKKALAFMDALMSDVGYGTATTTTSSNLEEQYDPNQSAQKAAKKSKKKPEEPKGDKLSEF